MNDGCQDDRIMDDYYDDDDDDEKDGYDFDDDFNLLKKQHK